jgi:hypothetical protein
MAKSTDKCKKGENMTKRLMHETIKKSSGIEKGCKCHNIENIKLIRFQKDDVIVFKAHENISDSAAKRLDEILKEEFKHIIKNKRIKILVVTGDVDIKVMREKI